MRVSAEKRQRPEDQKAFYYGTQISRLSEEPNQAPSEHGIPFSAPGTSAVPAETHVCSRTCAFGVGNQVICSPLIKGL